LYVAGRNHLGSDEAIIDVHEASSLISGTPYFDFVAPRELGLDDLATNGRGRLLPAAGPGPVRTVHVVVTRHPRGDTEILPEVAAHALAEELLPPVAVFGHRRVGVGLL